jgi:hypothetical protein
MNKAKYIFGDIVVVDGDLIGCIVKTWVSELGVQYEVYVRIYNAIKNYDEEKVQRYIYSKELSEEEKSWHE